MLLCLLRRIGVFAALSILLLCGGCGGETWRPVGGTVTLDGKPLEQGTISFEPADGHGPSGGGGIENGQYQAPRVMAGKKIVRISAFRKTGRKERALGGPGGLYASQMVDEVKEFIPDVYNTHTTLSCEVGGGQNRFNFELKSR